VRERTGELDAAQFEILDRLALLSDFRDDVTGQHARRVGDTAALVAHALGLPAAEAELYRWAAPLHDIGKIAIPDRVLLKPGCLSAEEFEQMKTHAAIGARLLSGSRFPILRLGEQIALTHHERWDGLGYLRLCRHPALRAHRRRL
jgi:putative nucleotidyltransferase with HDIG domain